MDFVFCTLCTVPNVPSTVYIVHWIGHIRHTGHTINTANYTVHTKHCTICTLCTLKILACFFSIIVHIKYLLSNKKLIKLDKKKILLNFTIKPSLDCFLKCPYLCTKLEFTTLNSNLKVNLIHTDAIYVLINTLLFVYLALQDMSHFSLIY